MDNPLVILDRSYTHVKQRELTKINLTVRYKTEVDQETQYVRFTAIADPYPEDTDFLLTIDGCQYSNKNINPTVQELLDIYDFENYVLDIHPEHYGSNIITDLKLPAKHTT